MKSIRHLPLRRGDDTVAVIEYCSSRRGGSGRMSSSKPPRYDPHPSSRPSRGPRRHGGFSLGRAAPPPTIRDQSATSVAAAAGQRFKGSTILRPRVGKDLPMFARPFRPHERILDRHRTANRRTEPHRRAAGPPRRRSVGSARANGLGAVLATPVPGALIIDGRLRKLDGPPWLVGAGLSIVACSKSSIARAHRGLEEREARRGCPSLPPGSTASGP